MNMKGSCSDSEACDPKGRGSASQRIFETACRLFYKRGIRAVGVEEIVTEAGVTKPSLYRSYGSKDELINACLEKYAEVSSNDICTALAAAGDDPRARLRAYIGHYAQQMTQPGFRGCPMSNLAVEFPEPGQPGRDIAERCKIGCRDQLVELTRALRTREPEALADGLVLLIEGAYSTHHLFGSQGPGQSLMRAADALIEAYSTR